jgi:hypothetical protein
VQLATLGNTALPGSPADFGRLIAKETEKWAKVIKFANIKPGCDCASFRVLAEIFTDPALFPAQADPR